MVFFISTVSTKYIQIRRRLRTMYMFCKFITLLFESHKSYFQSTNFPSIKYTYVYVLQFSSQLFFFLISTRFSNQHHRLVAGGRGNAYRIRFPKPYILEYEADAGYDETRVWAFCFIFRCFRFCIQFCVEYSRNSTATKNILVSSVEKLSTKGRDTDVGNSVRVFLFQFSSRLGVVQWARGNNLANLPSRV